MSPEIIYSNFHELFRKIKNYEKLIELNIIDVKLIAKPFYGPNRALVERTLFCSKTNLGLELQSVAHDCRPSKVIFAMVLNFELFF